VLTLAKKQIQPRAIAVIVALLTGCTFVMDRVVAFIVSPYLNDYYNAVIVKKSIQPNGREITNILYAVKLYYLVVYHFFVLIAVLLVFLHPKFKPFKRELFVAYITIFVAQMIWVIGRLINLKML
jgi:hypothetical protein